MKLSSFARAAFLVAGLALTTASLPAQDPGIRQRMEQRLPTIDGMKDRHLVGENNRGFLEARASLTPADEKVVSDENADRAAIYTAIAQQTGSTPDAVGRLRATKIAASSKRGVWIQTPTDEWIQKG